MFSKKILRKIAYGTMFIIASVMIAGAPVLADETDDEMNQDDSENAPIVVVIDPGHGGENSGAIWEEYVEKEITMITAKAMKEELEKYDGIRVCMTREEDVDLSLAQRAEVAKEEDADLFVCVHYNMSEYHKLYGAECWVSAFGSCYAVGNDFSKIEMELLTDLGLYDRGIKTRLNGKGTDYYGAIRQNTANNIPAVIIEHCHLDQDNDAAFRDTDEWPKKYGVIDATAVAKYFGLKSEELGVDYSNEVHEATPIPDKRMDPDSTPPEYCKVEDFSINEETGEISGRVSGYDPDSKILYYSISYDGGVTYGEYYKYEPDENGEIAFSEFVPNNRWMWVKVAVLNMYGGITETPVLYKGRLIYIHDEVIDEENAESMPANLEDESVKQGMGGQHVISKDNVFLWFVVAVLILCGLILIAYKIQKAKRRRRRKKRRKQLDKRLKSEQNSDKDAAV